MRKLHYIQIGRHVAGSTCINCGKNLTDKHFAVADAAQWRKAIPRPIVFRPVLGVIAQVTACHGMRNPKPSTPKVAPQSRKTRDEVWTRRDGSKVTVEEMDADHAKNVLNMVLRRLRLRAERRAILRNQFEEELAEIVYDKWGQD